MDGGHRVCTKCQQKRVIQDEYGNSVCEACGTEQQFTNWQASFGGINGIQGSIVHIGDFSYKESKIYHAKKAIEECTFSLELSTARSEEVRQMIDEVTEGEYGGGNWFNVLIGACAYIVRRKENVPLAMAKVASVINCDVHELGRMVIRVVDYLGLILPEFDIVSSFESAIKSAPTFSTVLEDTEKTSQMIEQGRFLLQCSVMWFLTTGRQPTPVIAAVLVFVAELNQVDAKIDVVAKEIHAGVATSRLRYKELQKTLVQVAQALPWGKNVTVKNIVRNAPFIMQYMEMKSRLKPGEKRKKFGQSEFDLEDVISDCLRKQTEYSTDDCCVPNDAPYFEVEHSPENTRASFDELTALKISQECLCRIYKTFETDGAFNKSLGNMGETRSSSKWKKGFGSWESQEWWTGKTDLSTKLSLKQILEKNVGFSGLPPSFVSGALACTRRREKINAAKLRIKEIRQPANGLSSDKNSSVCITDCLQGRKDAGTVDWEDCIIEILLLHEVKEDEIEQGQYNRLLDLHVFNSANPRAMFARKRQKC